VTAVLADEAVFIMARYIIPVVVLPLAQMHACFLLHIVIRFFISPVCVAHSPVGHISFIAHHFPYKLGPGLWVFALPCCPYVDSETRVTFPAFRPLVSCKQSTSTLLLLTKHITRFNRPIIIICVKKLQLIHLMLLKPRAERAGEGSRKGLQPS